MIMSADVQAIKMGNKILLINPPSISNKGIYKELKYPPMGLMFLASVLRHHGYQPTIFDGDIESRALEKLEKIIREGDFKIAGISFSSMTSEGAFEAAKMIKKIDPSITVIAGGYHPTVMIKDTLLRPFFDFLVYGEGENTLPELLNFVSGKDKKISIENIIGIAFKKGEEVAVNAPRVPMVDLDKIPLPAYDLIDIGAYSNPSSTRKPYITYTRSRGCPFFCNFCGVQKMFTRKYRCESPQKTMDNIDYLVEKFKIREILFKDSEFVINKQSVMDFCDLLAARNYDLVWGCNARVDTVCEELLQKMKKAGCTQITYGVESGDQDILNNTGKKITLDQARNAIKLTKKIGIRCVTNFIIGHVGETRESVKKTIEFAKELDADYTVFGSLMAFPGSEIYDKSIINNWFINGTPKSFTYEDLRLNATKMTNEEIAYFLRKALSSFYFRPKYIVKRLVKSFLSFREMKNNFVGLFAIAKKMTTG